MNKEKQLIAIAEACGWKPNPFLMDMSGQVFPQSPPDYLNDLNAMHEAEKLLTHDQEDTFTEYLWRQKKQDRIANSYLWHSTAAERAEALLKALNLWKDT
jgi:hypothetical protein